MGKFDELRKKLITEDASYEALDAADECISKAMSDMTASIRELSEMRSFVRAHDEDMNDGAVLEWLVKQIDNSIKFYEAEDKDSVILPILAKLKSQVSSASAVNNISTEQSNNQETPRT